MAHWLWMRYGISDWKARRWIAAAHALEHLPGISEAFACGSLGIDKVVELTRFATPGTEDRLIVWAQGVSPGAIRHKGDLALRRSREETVEVETSRSVSWWYYDEGKRFGLGPGGSPRPTTSPGGSGAEGPTWTTWCSPAPSTTGWSTSTGGSSVGIPTAP